MNLTEVSQSPDTAPNSHSATSSPRSPRRSPNAVQQVQSEVDHILISASNTPYSLRVPPSGYGGAIPRRSVISRDSSADSTASATDATTSPLTSSTTVSKTCFCGHYTEVSKVLAPSIRVFQACVNSQLLGIFSKQTVLKV